MNIKGLMAGLAVAVVTVSNTQAADDIQIDDSRFDWSGWYFGAHAGYGTGDFDGTYDNGDAAGPFRFSSLDADGFLVGFHGGHNWQSGQFLFGLEADISFGSLEDDGASPEPPIRGPDPVSVEIDFLASIRARLGLTQDNWLIYGTGGFAYTRYELSITEVLPPIQSGSADYSDQGYVIGGGLEYAYNDQWTVRAEYLHYDFDDSNALSAVRFRDSDAGDNFGLDSVDVIRIGLSRKF